MQNYKSKIQILWSMRHWSMKYIDWRLTTAYPKGWKYIALHPIIFLKDIYKYLAWCQVFDGEKK